MFSANIVDQDLSFKGNDSFQNLFSTFFRCCIFSKTKIFSSEERILHLHKTLMNLIDFKMVTQRVLYENYFERVAQVDKSVLFIKNFTKDVTEKDITALSKDIEEVQLRTIFSKKVDNQRCAFFSGLIICISFLSGKEAHTPLGNIKTGIFCKKIGAGTHRLKLFVFIFSDEIFDLVPSIHY